MSCIFSSESLFTCAIVSIIRPLLINLSMLVCSRPLRFPTKDVERAASRLGGLGVEGPNLASIVTVRWQEAFDVRSMGGPP